MDEATVRVIATLVRRRAGPSSAASESDGMARLGASADTLARLYRRR